MGSGLFAPHVVESVRVEEVLGRMESVSMEKSKRLGGARIEVMGARISLERSSLKRCE